MEKSQENITILLHAYVYNVLYHYTIITVAGPHKAAWKKTLGQSFHEYSVVFDEIKHIESK